MPVYARIERAVKKTAIPAKDYGHIFHFTAVPCEDDGPDSVTA